MYGVFGKCLKRSLMGFGFLMTAIYSQDMVTEATLMACWIWVKVTWAIFINAWDSIGSSNMQPALSSTTNEEFGDSLTTEHQTMASATTAFLRCFPDIAKDIT